MPKLRVRLKIRKSTLEAHSLFLVTVINVPPHLCHESLSLLCISSQLVRRWYSGASGLTKGVTLLQLIPNRLQFGVDVVVLWLLADFGSETKDVFKDPDCVATVNLGAKEVVAEVAAALLVDGIIPAKQPDNVLRQCLNSIPARVGVVSTRFSDLNSMRKVCRLQADESGIVGLAVLFSKHR